MNQKIGWPAIVIAVVAVLLLLGLMVRRSGVSGGGEAHVSPGFQQLSPAEQQHALEAAELARRRRGGVPP